VHHPKVMVGGVPVSRQRVRTLRRLPLVDSRTASLRPLPSCRSSGPEGPFTPSRRTGRARGAPASVARPPGLAPSAVLPRSTIRSRSRTRRVRDPIRPTPRPSSIDESVPPSAVADGRRSLLPWALFPLEALQSLRRPRGLPRSRSRRRFRLSPAGGVCPESPLGVASAVGTEVPLLALPPTSWGS